MSRRSSAPLSATQSRTRAEVFAALGDETRLGIVARLSHGQLQSISRLTGEAKITRQAITKHLRVLENAGIVRSKRSGRENLFQLDPEAIDSAREFLNFISAQWDIALVSLKAFVENN